MTKIVLGVSSSIGIYKACEVLRGFQKNGCRVQVVMTRNAARLVTPTLFSALSGLETIVDLFEASVAREGGHISLAREAGLFCVAPATANIIGKFAWGVADDVPSTFFLAARCPVLLAPAMNEAMYLHPQTQANISRLKAAGVEFVEPEKGYLACKDEGWGRLAEPSRIVKAGMALLAGAAGLAGRRVLVTAGPTREHLDPVRFLSNPSSGRMGYALAAEARRRGADVVLVSGPTALPPPAGVSLKRVETAEEMKGAVVASFADADIVVMAAAPADFRFRSMHPQKLKKGGLGSEIGIEPTPDILTLLGRSRKGQFLVGFTAETEDLAGRARAKMAAKGADLMVANRVGPGLGFESEENEVLILFPSGEVRTTPRLSKREVSRLIFDAIEEAIEKKPA